RLDFWREEKIVAAAIFVVQVCRALPGRLGMVFPLRADAEFAACQARLAVEPTFNDPAVFVEPTFIFEASLRDIRLAPPWIAAEKDERHGFGKPVYLFLFDELTSLFLIGHGRR